MHLGTSFKFKVQNGIILLKFKIFFFGTPYFPDISFGQTVGAWPKPTYRGKLRISPKQGPNKEPPQTMGASTNNESTTLEAAYVNGNGA